MHWKATLLTLLCASPASAAPPEFERDVLPILNAHCLNCHGGLRQKNGLDLRTADSMTVGGTSGAAITAGDLDKSLLWQKVLKDEMPKTLIKLSADEKRVLKEWIVAGLPRSPNWRQPPIGRADAPGQPTQVAAQVDREIEKRLEKSGITPAPPSDDAEFLRRASLDLTGRLPTPEQVRAFLASNDADKRTKLIDEVLARPDHGRHWGLHWHHQLMPLVDGKRVYNQPLTDWLAKGFNENRKWSEIVGDLVTAVGKSDENPAIHFLAGLKDPDKMSGRAANVFLGINMECAECHNHPHTQWKQKEDYWALAAFFSQVKFGGSDKRGVVTATEAVGGRGPAVRIPSTALAAANSTVLPGFPGIGPRPDTRPNPSRKDLAAWLTAPENAYFASSAVNRTWNVFFGRGLVNPVNNLHDGNPATHPDVLALLAQEFRTSGWDTKHLVRCICATKAYRRTSRTEKENEQQESLYGRMPLRVMSPDTLYDAMVQTLEVSEIAIPGYVPPGGKTPPKSPPPRELFVNTFRQAEDANPREYDHGVLQILQLVNWKEFNLGGAVVKRLLDAKTPNDKVVEQLYLLSLSRLPTAAEKDRILRFVEKQTDRHAAFASVLWILINSSEFVFNH